MVFVNETGARFNFLDDYVDGKSELQDIPEVYSYRDKILADLFDMIMEPGYTTESDSVFNGKAGFAYLLLQHDLPTENLEKCRFDTLGQAQLFFMSSTVRWGQLPREQCSLLHGRLGILTVYTLIRWRANVVDENVFDELREIEKQYKIPAGLHKGFEPGEGCSWGSGMCGFLYCLAALLKAATKEQDKEEILVIMKRMSTYTINHLKACAREIPFKTTCIPDSRPYVTLPLRVQFGDNKDTEYLLGGCEGLMGVLYVLMIVGETIGAEWMTDVQASIECVMTMETSTADMPANIGHEDEREPETSFLTGSAAAVLLLCKAAETFPEKRSNFLRAAERLGETCWVRGIRVNEKDEVKVGLYDGITGNGYALLRLFQITKAHKWLHRAQQFALLLKETIGPEPIPSVSRTSLKPAPPGLPIGLFDGIGGVLCYLSACEKSFRSATDPTYDGPVPNIPLFEL